MASSVIQVRIECNATLMLAQMACVTGIISAKSEWERQIECTALSALNETQRMADAARKEIGQFNTSEIRVALDIERKHQ